jgi:hypothetical protein
MVAHDPPQISFQATVTFPMEFVAAASIDLSPKALQRAAKPRQDRTPSRRAISVAVT